MKRKDFNIVFSGLSLGEHQFTFELNNSFFELFEYDEHSNLKGDVNIVMNKHNTFLELTFTLNGSVEVVCDRTGLPFDQKLSNTFDLLVKFGDEYDDEDDERLILPHGDYQVNVAQYLYELVVLSIPQKHVHPDVLSGKIIPEYETEDETELEEKKEEEIDPRWDKLKNLLN